MLKVVTPRKMHAIEEQAIHAGIPQEELMERAGAALADLITNFATTSPNEKRPLLFVCGKGNNGGDGYTAARLLLKKGFKTHVWQLPFENPTPLLVTQKTRYEAAGGKVTQLDPTKPIPDITKDTLIIDAIFGIGFQGTVEGYYRTVIEAVNTLNRDIIAVDIPSGLNGETGEVLTCAIKASITAAIECPKLGFFLQQGWNFCGDIISLPIGLSPFITHSDAHYLEFQDLFPLLPKIVRSRHKYQAGHVVGIAGSRSMMGAALLAATATLKAGCGITHLLFPESAHQDAQGGPFELIKIPYHEEDAAPVIEWIHRANACFIGPGLGGTKAVDNFLRAIWDHIKIKSIIDADALNWIAKHFIPHKESGMLHFGPLPLSILTPHTGEMARLLGSQSRQPITEDFLKKCRDFAIYNETHIVLKGGPTFLFSPGEAITICPFGDPGMATAGAGDVLTGILASLLAQGLIPQHAMQLGCALHGLAGQACAQVNSSFCVTATSLIDYLPAAFSLVTRKR